MQKVMNPLAWLVSMQDQTEVVYFTSRDFKRLWYLQRRLSDHFLVIQTLTQNKFFRQLNRCTKYMLVHECVQLRLFHPGQLMLSAHKRSPLSPSFKLFN